MLSDSFSGSQGHRFRADDSGLEEENPVHRLRYASPYDLPIAHQSHPQYAPQPAHGPSPLPCPHNILISCSPNAAKVPCINRSY